MFCSGNVTERMRMGKQEINNEIIVDLYCGVGYYTLPFLIHTNVQFLHAFEWNENSILALKYNLDIANVSTNTYKLYEGDNRITSVSSELNHIADRICLGLLPSSEDGWPVAVRLLKSSGGILHVHMNINSKDLNEWLLYVCQRFQTLFYEVLASKIIFN